MTIARSWVASTPFAILQLSSKPCLFNSRPQLRPCLFLNRKLKTLPELFFKGQRQLVSINLHSSLHLADNEPLPERLLEGLSGLDRFDFSECSFKTLPSLAGLTVCAMLCQQL